MENQIRFHDDKKKKKNRQFYEYFQATQTAAPVSHHLELDSKHTVDITMGESVNELAKWIEFPDFHLIL